ncbi:MAG: putative baseplate assembly protein [Acidobacteriota bacterium]|nr:putative baseplate assembly protein [Acidobacteriota bacterium]
MIYFCCDENRRRLVRDATETALNGIDFLEVVDREAASPAERQRVLRVHFLKTFDPVPASFTTANVRIDGGERIRDVRAVAPISFTANDLLEVRVNTPGDFSTYTLRLVEKSGAPLDGLDPLLAAVDFSFKVECDSDFDCRAAEVCPPDSHDEPDIDYLAKDFNSFRQLMLDRLAVVAPQWTERNPADLGVALVELLAYVGDHLSYRQDATATEAYLGTARRRTSIRRHARLTDYAMHDGANARTWMHVEVSGGSLTLPNGTPLFTHVARAADVIEPGSNAHAEALAASPVVFETMHHAELHAAHNELQFYTWGEDECCLPRGATRATLVGRFEDLRADDVLIFKEMLGPQTGEAADADLTHRHAVRLTRVVESADPLFTDESESGGPLPVTEIEWAAADALPFPLCLSSRRERDGQPLTRVSVALGNIVLADHGLTISDEALDAVPAADPRLTVVSDAACERCGEQPSTLTMPRFRPRLKGAPLTMAATMTRTESIEGGTRRIAFDAQAPAVEAFQWEMKQVLPSISLFSGSDEWTIQRDLLSSDEFAPDFVAEVEADGSAALRFGDGEYGLRPAAGLIFNATYRVGGGARGNVGAESIAHVVTAIDGVVRATNPMPARGGVDPETIEHVRRSSPFAFRTQERAVTPEDYTMMAERHPEVQRAAATLRWTGSWHTVFLTVDRFGGLPVDEVFESRLRRHLERYRLAGHDIEIDAPRFVPLELELRVCVAPGYFRSNIKAALLEVFNHRTRPDGRRGFFHPNNFTFGQAVELSHIYAEAQRIEGVRFVEIRKLQRLGAKGGTRAITDGQLMMGRLEIARLDNDPNFPERGVLRLTMEGGR